MSDGQNKPVAGLKCNKCGTVKSLRAQRRKDADNVIIRYRKCMVCGWRVRTKEVFG